MIFVENQPQAVVLQYKTAERAREDRNRLCSSHQAPIILSDDYGRELTMAAKDLQLVLLQDVDRAAAGNLVSNVKNAVSQMAAQVRAQVEAGKDPALKGAIAAQQIMQGAGAFRQ
jgi:hypothetical protein